MLDRTEAIERLASFESLTLALSTAFLPDEVGTAVIKSLVPALGASAGTIVRFAPDDPRMLEVSSSLNYPKAIVDPWRRFSLDAPTPISECIRTRCAVLVPSKAAWLERYAFVEGPFGAAAAFPLLLDDGVVGAVGLSFATERSLSEEEVSFMLSLGRQCAVALERARLYESERRARRAAERTADRMARLQAVTAQLSGAMHPEDVAEVIISAGCAAMGAAKGFLVRNVGDGTCEMIRAAGLSPAFEELLARAHVALGFPPERVNGHYRFFLDAPTPLTEAIRTGVPVWASDLAAWGGGPAVIAALSLCGAGATACLPLMVEGRAIGGLRMIFKGKRTFSRDDRVFMELLAQECAFSLERARLRDMERRAAEQTTFLAEIGSQLAASLDWEKTVQNVAQLPVPRFAAACVVYFVKEGVLHPRAASCAPADIEALWEGALRAPLLEVGASIADHLARLGPSVASAIVAPLRSLSGELGVITFGRKACSPFLPEDVRFAEVLALRAELALENARLYQAAQSAIQDRDRFLAMASHELKTPLNPLQIQLELLLRSYRTGAPARAEERLTVAVGQVTRLNRLIEDLLNVSRMDAGKLLVELEDVDLGALVREVAARFEAEISQAGCTFSLVGPPVSGSWDRLRIDQVITNLLSNALKYGRGKPINVSVDVDPERAFLTVTDYGIGISVLDQGRLFGRFERAVAERHYSGFGLGLWIVRQIVEAHGGTVRVQSNLGEGATFHVELPRVPS